ncbi:MAG: RraA family protein [Pseudomonadota bacterium]
MNTSDFANYPTGNLCNADPSVRALSPALRPLIEGKTISGPARTARITPGQNAAIHKAVHDCEPGEVLVVESGGNDRYGPFGDLLAECCMMKGLAGAVLDCTFRDKKDVAALGFQVFGRGFHPEATAKIQPGETDAPICVGGVVIHPGDIIVGDDDGVVVIPHAKAASVLVSVKQVAAKEEEIRARIKAGETTYEIFNLGTQK